MLIHSIPIFFSFAKHKATLFYLISFWDALSMFLKKEVITFLILNFHWSLLNVVLPKMA